MQNIPLEYRFSSKERSISKLYEIYEKSYERSYARHLEYLKVTAHIRETNTDPLIYSGRSENGSSLFYKLTQTGYTIDWLGDEKRKVKLAKLQANHDTEYKRMCDSFLIANTLWLDSNGAMHRMRKLLMEEMSKKLRKIVRPESVYSDRVDHIKIKIGQRVIMVTARSKNPEWVDFEFFFGEVTEVDMSDM